MHVYVLYNAADKQNTQIKKVQRLLKLRHTHTHSLSLSLSLSLYRATVGALGPSSSQSRDMSSLGA